MVKPVKSFSNTTMREPVKGKPHIAFIDGFWRVSPWKRGNCLAYRSAHLFITKLNNLEANRRYLVSLIPSGLGPLGVNLELPLKRPLKPLTLPVKAVE